MMKIRAFISALMLGIASVASAQIEWLQTTYDFGTFQEEGGPREGRVQLINRGSAPTAINRVKSTCGCTVAGFTEGLIEPGDTATVWFTYNPMGRPGRFEKHIRVYTGVDNTLTSITIKGTVIGSDASLSAKYPVEVGPIRLSTTGLGLGKVSFGTSRHEYISGYNRSNDTLNLAWTETPVALSLGVSNKRVAPGDIFMIGIYFNTRDEAQMGPVDYEFHLFPDADNKAEYVPIHITADIVPDTASLSEAQLRDAPFLSISPDIVDLGTLSKDSKPQKISFRLRNEGRTPLHVNRICMPACKAFKVKLMPGTIDPGKDYEVVGEITPAALPAGPFSLFVQIISDDPLHPSRTVRLIGTYNP